MKTLQKFQYCLEHLVIEKLKFVSDFDIRISDFCLVLEFGTLLNPSDD